MYRGVLDASPNAAWVQKDFNPGLPGKSPLSQPLINAMAGR